MFRSGRLISHLRKNKTLTESFFSHLNRSSSPSSSSSSISRASNESLSRFFASKSSTNSFAGWNAFRTFRSVQKGLSGPSSRNMSTTTASLLASKKADATNAGLKLLVTEGPYAQKVVGIWLFGCAAWVFSMVVLGGVTRLTRSGLSMTDWKFTGSLPPLSEEQWHLEFEKYQQSPEYKRVNKGMSIEDFKFIYWMEYAHRMWGRGLGLVFALPYSYFLWKGYITRQLGLRLSALFALGAGQGLIGWWMVKSGLEEPESEYVQPRVSPYRLATHLTSAFVIYGGLLWTGLSVVMPEPPTGSMDWVRGAAKVRNLALPVSILVGLTAVSGAFVAGNDAGHAYNTFPKMGDTWIPDDVFSMEPLIRNFFENTSTVQLDHRILATATLLSISGMWLATRKFDIHPAVKSIIGSTMGMAALQVTLGISTLLSYVPVSLASAHQAGALTLMTLTILLTHSVRKPSPTLLRSLSLLPKSTS
ncbi:cytochrome c oxidase assembly protein COX15 [Magnolia sinica]|uniref:cytochrome c oxidase assembly protein COX15 n=1 Tax=Magnolia sinica TaxID=86752 RepID=UPI0026589C67|nr:cytochrome c oxidase assembly protein COX15 [Magnolia sinica]